MLWETRWRDWSGWEGQERLDNEPRSKGRVEVNEVKRAGRLNPNPLTLEKFTKVGKYFFLWTPKTRKHRKTGKSRDCLIWSRLGKKRKGKGGKVRHTPISWVRSPWSHIPNLYREIELSANSCDPQPLLEEGFPIHGHYGRPRATWWVLCACELLLTL